MRIVAFMYHYSQKYENYRKETLHATIDEYRTLCGEKITGKKIWEFSDVSISQFYGMDSTPDRKICRRCKATHLSIYNQLYYAVQRTRKKKKTAH